MNRSAKTRQIIEEIDREEYQMGGATFRVVSFFNAIAAFVCNLFTNKKQ